MTAGDESGDADVLVAAVSGLHDHFLDPDQSCGGEVQQNGEDCRHSGLDRLFPNLV